MACWIAALSAADAQTVSLNKNVPSALAKGSLQLGVHGTGGITGSGMNGKGRTYVLSPWAGYLLQDKLLTGLAFTYSDDKYTSKDTNIRPDLHRTSLSPELFARYYLMPGKLKPYAQLGAGYNFLKTDEAKENGAYLSPAVGLSYWLGQGFALEANYQFKLQKESLKGIDPATNLKFRIGFSVGIRR